MDVLRSAYPVTEQMGRVMRHTAVFLCMAVALAACTDSSSRFPVTKEEQAQIEGVTVVSLSSANIGVIGTPATGVSRTTLPAAGGGEYRIGPGDEISIFVFDHPELAIPAGSDSVNTGFLVQSDGMLTFPFIGSVRASGRTVEELRKDLATRLTEYFPAPQVDVRIATFNSKRVVVGGEVASPVTQFIRATPLTLLEAINAAGGMTTDADPSAITVRRKGMNHRVDLNAFLTAGIAANNPVLLADDVVSVPRKTLREVYLLGEVQKPATIELSDETVSLTQALTRQGGLNEMRADARGVFVFRDVAGQMTVYQLDVSSPVALAIGTRFVLQPRDVVYVTKSPLQRWNDTISRILPSVAAANAARSM